MNKKYILAAMATSFALTINAQSVKVTGTVVDSNNEPIIGAFVKVKGTSNGAVTDMDGNTSSMPTRMLSSKCLT
jgi:hypothetical protein